MKFLELFRFDRDDIDELRTLLRVPEKVMSTQCVRVSGMEAFCMTMRRLAYPNRLCELEVEFGCHGTVTSSVVNKVLAHIEYYFTHLLSDMKSHRWMNPSQLQEFAEVRTHCVYARSALLCFRPSMRGVPHSGASGASLMGRHAAFAAPHWTSKNSSLGTKDVMLSNTKPSRVPTASSAS